MAARATSRVAWVCMGRASYNARPMNAAAKEIENPLRVEFCGLSLNSPIVLLSGCVGFGEEYTRVEGFSNRDVGAIVLKGTTGQPRLGNKPHRVYETPSGMLNAIGLSMPGGVSYTRCARSCRSEEH